MKNNILGNLKYLIKHKWFVFLECCKVGIVWQGIIHDWSKIRPSEFFPYANHDFDAERDETGYYKPTDTGDKEFDYARLLHQKRNKHHWQNWVEKRGNLKKNIMPKIYKRICNYCKKYYEGYGKKYCGRSCAGKATGFKNKHTTNIGRIQSFIAKKEKNPAWQGGKLRNGYLTYEFNEKLKDKIKQKDNYQCQLCLEKSDLVIHHIDYDKTNNKESNLVTLCRSCNAKVNFDRDKWTFYFSILPKDNGGIKVLEMPIKYRKEMLCDWEGAHRAQKTKGTPKDWYLKHKDKMQLHPETRNYVEKTLGI